MSLIIFVDISATALLDEDRFLAWSRAYKNALTDRSEVEKRRSGVSHMNDIDILEDYIEKDLELLGVTGGCIYLICLLGETRYK